MLPQRVIELLDRGETIAAKVEAIRKGLRAWVGVCAFSIDPRSGISIPSSPERGIVFRVRCIELCDEFDLDEYDFHGDECEYRLDERCSTLGEVEGLVSSVLPDLERLDDGRLCDYPFS